MKRKLFLGVVVLFLLPNVTFGQTSPDLGATSSFALFTATGAFANAGASTITGDVGTNAGAFAGFGTPGGSPGTLIGSIHVADDVSAKAAADVAVAYSELNQGGATINTVLDGLILTPGVYSTGAISSLSANGVLTLDGQGNPDALFIIRIGGAFATGSDSRILLINSASLSKVYWQIDGQFDLGINSIFRGTIIASGAINLLEGSTLFGRGLSTAGAISLQNNTVTIPSHFRSKVSGNWNANEIWESSSDSISWVNTVDIPTSNAISVNISNGHTVTITDNATASTLFINPGARLTLNSAQTLTANIFNINSDATGTGTFVDANAAGGLTVTGTTNVQQYLSSARNWYMSSPVVGATAPVGNTYYKYIEAGNNGTTWTPVSSGDVFSKMTGYIVQPIIANPINFNGSSLYTGDQSISGLTMTSTAKIGYNLVGNPYPSYVDWNQATKTNLSNTMWYRTNDGSAWKFYTYITVDGAGGIGVPASITNMIPPMQAFWVRVTSGTGTLGFTNTSRSHKVDANVFRAPAAKTSVNKILRLQVAAGSITDEAVVYFNPNASNGYDAYDSPKMMNGTTSIVPDIYTIAGTEQLVINGMNTISYDVEIPLYFNANASSTGTFGLSSDEMSNFETGTKVYVKNNKTGEQQIISDGTIYTFDATAVGSDPAFSLIFKAPGAITAIPTVANDQNLLVYRNANNQIAVQIKGQLNDAYSLDVYNSVGQKLASKRANAGITILDAPQSGVYFVTIKGNGNNTTKKVVIN
jgi:hypothetical protein